MNININLYALPVPSGYLDVDLLNKAKANDLMVKCDLDSDDVWILGNAHDISRFMSLHVFGLDESEILKKVNLFTITNIEGHRNEILL